MTHKKQTTPVITNAIIWAAMMIATALLMGDADSAKSGTLLMLQIAAWFTVHHSLTGGGRSAAEEWACIKRRFGGNKSSKA